MNSKCKIKHDAQSMREIAMDYYSSLYDEKKTNSRVSQVTTKHQKANYSTTESYIGQNCYKWRTRKRGIQAPET